MGAPASTYNEPEILETAPIIAEGSQNISDTAVVHEIDNSTPTPEMSAS